MTRIICVKGGPAFLRDLLLIQRRRSLHRGRAQAMFIAWGTFALACQSGETEHHIQDDTAEEQLGGSPPVSPEPSPPSNEAGNGGGAGAAGVPHPQKLLIPCDVQAILERYCFKCHADRIEPRLDLYETATAVSREIRGALVGTGPREMPPRENLPDNLRQQIVDWIKAGTPPAVSEATCP